MSFEISLRQLLDNENQSVLPITVHIVEQPDGELSIALLDADGARREWQVRGDTLIAPAKPEPIRIAVQGFTPYVGMGG